jgi:hypothetical protein
MDKTPENLKPLISSINNLIEGVVKGQRTGAYTLEESSALLTSISIVKKHFDSTNKTVTECIPETDE